MQTKILKVEKVPSPAIAEAAEIIKAGGLVAFPTETVYGLGGNGIDAKASAGIYAAKGRPSDNPLILHVADMAMLKTIAAEITESAKQIIAAFCPGPVTMILKRKEIVPSSITGGLDTVGIRMPDNDIARELIRLSGVPIAAPSANISGRPSPTTAESVARDLAGKIEYILDGGPCSLGVESTIVDCTGDVPTVLRPGAVTMEMLKEVLGEVQLDPALVGVDSVPKAPGMKYTHYAPKAPLTLLEGKKGKMAAAFSREIKSLEAAGKTVGIIVSHEVDAVLQHAPSVVYGKQGDLESIAANLYEALRAFDDESVTVLLAEGTEENGIGLAIMNRLHKASGFRTIHV